MSEVALLGLGFGLGLRHATDVDHLVVVAGLVQREAGIRRAARIAALWGVGHTFTFLLLGLCIVLADMRLPPAFELLAERLVACMLIGFGLWHLLQVRRMPHSSSCAPSSAADLRPVFVGVVHGLAGSTGIALIAATTIDSRGLAFAYLGLVALGTVAGMVALTVLLARPIGWTMRGDGRGRAWLRGAAATLSLSLGAAILLTPPSPGITP